MAQIGLKNIYYAVLQSETATTATYATPVKIGNAISVDVNPSANKATLYGDDMPIDVKSNITEIAVSIETSDIPLADQAVLLGHTIESDTLVAKTTDIAPYVALLFESETHEGKKRCVKLLKGQFELTQETTNTRGENLQYQVPKLNGSFVSRKDGKWKFVKDFEVGADTAGWYASVE